MPPGGSTTSSDRTWRRRRRRRQRRREMLQWRNKRGRNWGWKSYRQDRTAGGRQDLAGSRMKHVAGNTIRWSSWHSANPLRTSLPLNRCVWSHGRWIRGNLHDRALTYHRRWRFNLLARRSRYTIFIFLLWPRTNSQNYATRPLPLGEAMKVYGRITVSSASRTDLPRRKWIVSHTLPSTAARWRCHGAPQGATITWSILENEAHVAR